MEEQASWRRELTNAERRVLLLLMENYSTKQIAQILGIRMGTLDGHQRKIYRKLGVHSREDAVRKGRELGLPT